MNRIVSKQRNDRIIKLYLDGHRAYEIATMMMADSDHVTRTIRAYKKKVKK